MADNQNENSTPAEASNAPAPEAKAETAPASEAPAPALKPGTRISSTGIYTSNSNSSTL